MISAFDVKQNFSVSSNQIKQGSVCWVNFDKETIGTEIRDTHPAVIISNDWYNEKSNRVVVLPCSTKLGNTYPFDIVVKNLSNNGKDGKIIVDQIKSIDKQRISGKSVKQLSNGDLLRIKAVLDRLFKLSCNFPFVKSKL